MALYIVVTLLGCLGRKLAFLPSRQSTRMEPGWKIRPETFFFGLPTRPETGMETGMKLGRKSGLVGLPKNRVPEPKKNNFTLKD